MDFQESNQQRVVDGSADEAIPAARQLPLDLPLDLPKSLDDRKPIRSYGGEVEMYDAWQGTVSGQFESTRSNTFQANLVTLILYQYHPLLSTFPYQTTATKRSNSPIKLKIMIVV